MAKPNYAFAKRQRDLAKKQKKEEKQQRKSTGVNETPSETEEAQENQPLPSADDTPAA